MMKKVVLFVALALVLAACGGGAAETTRITVTMKEFTFEPNPITVAAGTPVEITLVNEGAVEHDFAIESIPAENVVTEGSMNDHAMTEEHSEFDVHTATAVGESSVLRFTPTQPGTYQIICSVPGHKEAGMIGELIVK
jgi:uncharacterized cupredoxin-like copper-binding protein